MPFVVVTLVLAAPPGGWGSSSRASRASSSTSRYSRSQRTAEDDPGAPFFNETTKYVVSSALTTTTWRNSQLLGPYDPATIGRLKDDTDGDLYVSGSGSLVRAMLADGLVDQLNLFVYPLTRGSGPRLFAQDASAHKMMLAKSEVYENGVVYLNYRVET